ncbi:hypothetical protein FOPG_09328 [Fusarium oxysporum f. sp. conglutinans race 2 54008]|uniref:Uncharacterized protein n=1 Tax=Fusarium oxysporum f. sp. conglutinans race 2 54008 TaxID=1089457 RepID=X0HW01_FUSOX|nr:hypothetical protein FOPG_09328 [Fusarium oxysporum f. sp. conglutinans race 2 54008]
MEMLLSSPLDTKEKAFRSPTALRRSKVLSSPY